MLGVNSFARGLKLTIALSLITSTIHAQTVAFPAETTPSARESFTAQEWIFPGQTLPQDVGFIPVRASSQPGADVPLTSQDWFLLKNKNLSILSPGSTTAVDIVGPVLNDMNAQFYFRMVTGMILKESMQQLSMSASQAKEYIERAKLSGRDFATTPISEMGPLPAGFEDLYRNWERPFVRMSVLPYMILPVSIGLDRSNFQHFSAATIKDTTGAAESKSCSAMNTLAPLAGIQAQIDSTRPQLDALTEALRNAQALTEQSNAELVRLTGKVKNQSGVIETNMACFSSIKDRVSRGAQIPTEACLQLAQAVFAKEKMENVWTKFTTVNLQNPKGDFQVLQEEDIRLKTQEAKLQVLRQNVQILKDLKAKVEGEKATNDGKLAKLSDDKDLQLKSELALNQEQENLNLEFQTLQQISHKLENGTLSLEVTEDEVKTQIAQTPVRAARMLQIKARLPEILQAKSQVQQNLTAILSQVEFLGRAIDTNRLQIESVDQQMGDGQAGAKGGLSLELAQQENLVTTANQTYLEASKQSNFSEYALSILTKDLIVASQDRDLNFELLRKEEKLLAQYKDQITAAALQKDTRWEGLQQTLAGLNSVLASYRDPKEMGWFLETDCESRQKYDSEMTGIYLSRAKVTNNTFKAGERVNAGQWGLFNLPYDAFKNSVQNGVLLNLESYIQLSVRKMFENYDFAMAQFMNPGPQSCPALASGNTGIGTSIVNLLKSASAIWEAGSDSTAQTTAACSPAPQYSNSLSQLLKFSGSAIDQALPLKGQSQPTDLIEREALEALSSEISILTGSGTSVMASADRRDTLIKALIKVLAFDYNQANHLAQNVDPKKSKYQFAVAATIPSAMNGLVLAVGSTQTIKNPEGAVLYSSPLASADYEITTRLAPGTIVILEALNSASPQMATMAGWLKVRNVDGQGQATGPAYYMTVGALVEEQIIEDLGPSALENADDTKCPVRRLVTELTNFDARDTVVTRFLPNIKTGLFKNGMWQMTRANTKAAAGTIGKTYIACELFAVKGQHASPQKNTTYQDANVDYAKVQGIRIVEVKVIQGKNGESRYIPIENYGGFVHTWLRNKNFEKPRVILGGVIDSKTWSLQK